MSTLATLVLVFLGIAMAINLANGTAGAWLKAKFLNSPTIPKASTST